ncbi:oligosaccharide flippase family protein [Ktedonospora formicarum]|uniref:Polysaccharide biosynthesis protein n=1 Tax=Ktedonospora formicarum TaxID=2778364 RepID=A0A8J3I4Y3_9CHLR|nr:oligosaccharide flippase family protein [Ktedonospora formicarum]GHO45484.1 hypothetical protein KSX_36470 [Ktedonospora formicarum]
MKKKNDSLKRHAIFTSGKEFAIRLVTGNPVAAKINQKAKSEEEARGLLQRTPNSYLLNQGYGLWVYISWFILTLIFTDKLTTDQYGVYAVATTAYNTILYIVAFGFEDATYTYLPRVFAEHGHASAASLIRRLIGLRTVALVLTAGIMLFGLPGLAALIGLLPIQGTSGIIKGLQDPKLLDHILPITLYVLTSSIASLLTALCTGLMRMRIVFVLGSLAQCALLIFGYILLQMGQGVTEILWMLALVSLLQMIGYLIWLLPFLTEKGAVYKQPLSPLIKLGINAWLTNLVSGAFLKQISIILLTLFAVRIAEIGYFNLAFQLADAANILLVAGFGGVAGSALAASFIGDNHERLSRSWQALIKIETLLAAPGLVFCLFSANNIANALYSERFNDVGLLLGIFVFFNLLMRILGTYIHQPSLYVVGKAHLAVLSQWLGLLIVVLVGVVLIGELHMGAAGALIADGIGRVFTGGLMLAFLWKDLPHKYPLDFTLRFLGALILAAIPSTLWLSILWQPDNRPLLLGALGASGILFLALCVLILRWLKPLNQQDIALLKSVKPRLVRYLLWFARS